MRAALTALAVLALAAIAGCGGDEDDDGPTRADIPAGAVAVVGESAIGKDQLAREVAALRRGQQGAPGKVSRKRLESQALGALLHTEWLEQEAQRRGIEVSMAEVRRRWRAAAGAQFETKRELRRFLRGQTRADVLRELRRQELTERIYAQIRERAGNPERAVAAFQAESQRLAAESTVCRAGYRASGCGD